MEAPRSITLDGISYDLDQFSDVLKQAVAVYHTFNVQLGQERLAVIKSEAALQTIGKQIADQATKELAEAKAAKDAADTTVAAE